jgi:hypothetical protein
MCPSACALLASGLEKKQQTKTNIDRHRIQGSANAGCTLGEAFSPRPPPNRPPLALLARADEVIE